MKRETVDLFRGIFKILKPPPERTMSGWADDNRRLSREASAEPGRWRTDRAPYQREIMDAISDIHIRKVVVKSSAQVGKTDAFVLNTIGYFVHYDPSPIMVMQPTIQMGEDFSKDRLSTMIRDTPVLAERIDDRSRTSGNTILHKSFPGGHVTVVGANSPSSLASRPIRILLADEIDRYPPSAGNEGDPLLLAEKRTTTYWNKKIVCVSTPTIKSLSRIEVEYEHSTQEAWNVPCPDCGEMQPLEWGRIKFDRKDLTTVYHECIHCGVVMDEHAWKARFGAGQFIAEYPERPVRGFHLNALASGFTTWNEIVEKFLKANEEKKKGNIEPLKVWTNTEMGQCWEEEGETLEDEDIAARREDYGCEVPYRVICLTAGVDVQDNRFEIEVVGWGEDKESWGIRYDVLYGDPKLEQVWQDLDDYLSQTFTRADGVHLHLICVCIDSGGHFFNEVCVFTKEREARRVFAIRGAGGFDKPYIPKPTRNNRVKALLFTLGVDTGKSLVYDRLRVERDGRDGDVPVPGYCHFPADLDKGYADTYFRGLTAEKMVVTYKQGRAQYVWTLKERSFKRNEPLDCRNYAQAALEIANPVLKWSDPSPRPVRRGRRKRSGGIGG